MDEIICELNLGRMRADLIGPKIEAHRDDIVKLLQDTAGFVEQCLETDEWISIDGL